MRLVLGWLIAVVVTILAFVAMGLALPFSRHGKAATVLTRWWGWAVLRGAGVRIKRSGLEHVPTGPCVIIANHTSMFDICAVAAAVPLHFHFVSRPFFFKVPVLGWAMFLGRHARIDPESPREARDVLGRLGVRFERGLSICLFPEGERSLDGTLQRYRRGPFLLAIDNGVPVLPVHLGGLFRILPRGSLRFQPGEVRVTIGAPIPTEGLGSRDARPMAARVEAWTRELEAAGS